MVNQGESLQSFLQSTARFPQSGPILQNGVEFTVTVVSTSPDLVSQISFVVSATVNGRTLECSGVSTSSGAVSRTLTLLVEESINKFIMLYIIIIVSLPKYSVTLTTICKYHAPGTDSLCC